MSAKVDIAPHSILVWCNERGCGGFREWADSPEDAHRRAAHHENCMHRAKRTANANLQKYLKRHAD